MPHVKNNNSRRVLVAPLDWGLGHATRCIPLIRRLLRDGHQLFLAGSGPSGQLLRSEFPDLPYSEIPSHSVRYARSGRGFFWMILKQIPALNEQIRSEKKWLQDFITTQPIDQIISDNRYGLHHHGTQNILITHQLGLRSGIGSWADQVLQWMLTQLLKHFHEIWVPDHEGEPNLSGELGHPKYKPPVPVKYIGPLSRFTQTNRSCIPKKITVVLSGPEPQRTLLEEKCLRELNDWDGPVTIVRGLPNGSNTLQAPAHWKISDHLSIDALEQEIEEAEHFIARCGYSTLMDLAVLKKQAILIPTPGQPEQEYLASRMKERSQYVIIDQQQDLREAVEIASRKSVADDKFAAR
jgi:predicted glycosyltransferase